MRRREQDKPIVEQYRQGKSVTQIAGHYRVSVSTVYTVLKEAGLELGKKRRDDVLKRRMQVQKLHEQGIGPKCIAEKLNVPIVWIYFDLSALGLTHGKDTTKRRERVRELHQQGKLTQEIANILDIPIKKVYYDLSILRLPSNPIPRGPKEVVAKVDKRHTPEWRAKVAERQVGMSNTQAKLNDEIVTMIRKEYQQALVTGYKKTATQKHLASKYEVSRSTILDIIHDRTWTHLL